MRMSDVSGLASQQHFARIHVSCLVMAAFLHLCTELKPGLCLYGLHCDVLDWRTVLQGVYNRNDCIDSTSPFGLGNPATLSLVRVSGQPRRSFQSPVLAVDYDQLLGFPYSGEAFNSLKRSQPCAIGRRRIC